MIAGVEIKELETHTDERGFFREIIRKTDGFFGEGFGQFSHAMMYPGVAKAWHIHKTQVDWWYVPVGNLKVALYDKRPDSQTSGQTQVLFMGENFNAKVLKIPAGVAHGCKVLGGVAHLFYITSNVYDIKEEGRIPHNDTEIGFDWESGPEIK
ncbi:MAG: dTDP-4-dehydrorhamnose 3,5-epimerase family protein [bacterium]